MRSWQTGGRVVEDLLGPLQGEAGMIRLPRPSGLDDDVGQNVLNILLLVVQPVAVVDSMTNVICLGEECGVRQNRTVPPADVSRKDHRPAGAVYLVCSSIMADPRTWPASRKTAWIPPAQGSAHRTSPETAGETRPARPRQCRVDPQGTALGGLLSHAAGALSVHLPLQFAESNSMIGTISAWAGTEYLARKPSRHQLR